MRSLALFALALVACEDSSPPPRSAGVSADEWAKFDSGIPAHGSLQVETLPEHPQKRDELGNPIASPSPNGGLTPQQIRAVVMANVRTVRDCYDARLKANPTLKGGMIIAWTIALDGTTTSASIVSSNINDSVVESCVVNAVRQFQFPASDAATYVSEYPFKFGVGK